jgi:pimeloyl-ACP methyl ester carboxylesterase
MQGQTGTMVGQVSLCSGGGPAVWIAPANGFPPEVYGPFAAALGSGHAVVGYRPPPLRGAAAVDYPTWRQLADDLVAQLPTDQPVIGIGHSLGAILTLYAAQAAPQRFTGIVLIDPVIFGRRLRWIIDVLQRFGRGGRIPRAVSAQRRRDRFASPQEAHDRWRSRPVFAEFDEAALHAYVTAGLTETGPNSWQLSWPRDWETHIFATSPTDGWARLAALQLPTLIVRGRHSDLITDRLWQRLQRHAPQLEYQEVAAGHLLPMEVPHEVAYHVGQWLQACGISRAAADAGDNR